MYVYGGGGGSRTRVRKNLRQRVFMLFPVHFVSLSALRTDKDVPTTSLIDLAIPAQTEQVWPAYCATIGIRP